MFALSAELLLLDEIIAKVFPALVLPPMSVALGILALFTVLNLLNIDIFARLQTALAVVMMIVLLLLGLTAIEHEQAHSVSEIITQGAGNPMGWGVLALAAMAIWGFVGAEFVCPLVEESERPARDIPRSMFFGLTAIFVTIAIYCLGALLLIPREDLATQRPAALPVCNHRIWQNGTAFPRNGGGDGHLQHPQTLRWQPFPGC
ncbi:putative transporter [Pluralibacter gergoviae]|nr:putative transporter [Pluralibacter gergoviae]